MVMLADTDAGSIVTAAQSGSRWGYRLLPLEVLLIPVLYLVMELTVRLGATTGKGHAQAIRERYGLRWAALSVGTLLISATGALITEFAGVALVGEFVGLSPMVTVPLAAAFLLTVVLNGGYGRVERIGLALGSFELAFLAAALLAHPRIGSVTASLWSHQPIGSRGYMTLAAANLGAVVMPWMIFYQQGAVVDKGLREQHIPMARFDTALGAVLTQAVMAAILIATASTASGHGTSLTSIGGNALLLPIVIGFLVALAWTTLPPRHRLRTRERLGVALIVTVVVVVARAP